MQPECNQCSSFVHVFGLHNGCILSCQNGFSPKCNLSRNPPRRSPAASPCAQLRRHSRHRGEHPATLRSSRARTTTTNRRGTVGARACKHPRHDVPNAGSYLRVEARRRRRRHAPAPPRGLQPPRAGVRQPHRGRFVRPTYPSAIARPNGARPGWLLAPGASPVIGDDGRCQRAPQPAGRRARCAQ